MSVKRERVSRSVEVEVSVYYCSACGGRAELGDESYASPVGWWFLSNLNDGNWEHWEFCSAPCLLKGTREILWLPETDAAGEAPQG